MPNTLNTIELPEDLRWVEREVFAPVTGTAKVTKGGVLWVWTQAVHNTPMTIQATTDNSAWVRRGIYEQIRTIMLSQPATMELVWEGIAYAVAFRYYEPPVLFAEEIKYQSDDVKLDTDWMKNLTIKLITIG